jgi:DNA invertase Pin-like site-specific DNA recombinase
MSAPAEHLNVLAYSYVRFSSPQQAEGDSLRRQTEAAADWCRRHGARLDTSTTFRDLGKSAYLGEHRKNPDRHALAAFLKLAEAGRVPRGSYLVIENLDRLSREHERAALRLWMDILDAGINIVQLTPETVFRHEKSDMVDIMRAVLELSRGHGESARKSERIGAVWGAKKRAARDGKKPITRSCPAWLKVEGGKFVAIEARVNAIRLVYELAVAGHGIGAIVRKLNRDRVAPIGPARNGRKGHWARVSVGRLLATRAVLGEYQPRRRRGDRRALDGPPVPDFYPRVIDEDLWHAAREAVESRRHKGGRPGRGARVNLWAGLLRDAWTGGAVWWVSKGRGYPTVLAPAGAEAGHPGAEPITFPAGIFESAVLSELREIDPREILPGDGTAARVLTLAGRLADAEGRLAKIQARMTEGDEDCGALVAVLRQLEAKRAAAAAELAQARREAASPLASAWGEYGSLADALDNAPDPADARVRLRAALRRMVEEIYCLFVVNGAWRAAAVQVYFAGGARRDYLILHRSAKANQSGCFRPEETSVRSFADVALAADDMDLRKPAHAKRLAKALSSLDPADLTGA